MIDLAEFPVQRNSTLNDADMAAYFDPQQAAGSDAILIADNAETLCLGAGLDVVEQPHPSAPWAFSTSSAAQHALVSSFGGAPQHPTIRAAGSTLQSLAA